MTILRPRCQTCGRRPEPGHFPWNRRGRAYSTLMVFDRWITDGRIAFRRSLAEPAWVYSSEAVALAYFRGTTHPRRETAGFAEDTEKSFDGLAARSDLVPLERSRFLCLPAVGESPAAIFEGANGVKALVDLRIAKAFRLDTVWYEGPRTPLSTEQTDPRAIVMPMLVDPGVDLHHALRQLELAFPPPEKEPA